MKTIGIKLADGTFYPVLEEGEPKKRMLDLTTAKDNQTKVQIDLYRSETGTMDDAEYVDTLEVTKLNPHPNGEPELHLSVGLDENNHLTAEVVDPETGKKSETTVTLITRTEEEREAPADFSIKGMTEELATNNAEEATFSPDELPDFNSPALEDMPFSFDRASASSDATEVSGDEADGIPGELPDFSELDNDLPIEDTTLESVDFSKSKFDDEGSDVTETESPSLGEDDIQTDTTTVSDNSADDFSTDNFSLPDFDSIDSASSDADDSDPFALTDDDPQSADTTLATDDLPDFSDDFGSNDSADSTEPENFALPDFDTSSDFSADTENSATGLDFDDLDDPSFSSTEFDSTLDDLNSQSEDKLFDDIGTGAAAGGAAMDFSDLYDKETLAGEHASLYDEKEGKKTRAPVIICIICAIICVIATVLLLFVVPSKYNLLASRNTNGVSILDRFFSKEKVTVIEEPLEAAEPPAQTEEPPEETEFIDVSGESAPEAVEDKIVIAPEPEKVVPKPVVEEKQIDDKKSADVKYHIKWGDTLWDISESYYKTPWKYLKIADYNKIRNPDLIISGTDILIPAE